MYSSNGTIDQQIIYTQDEINSYLLKEISSAQREILITAEDVNLKPLLTLLSEKASQGVKVELMLNQKLEAGSTSALHQLALKGASVYYSTSSQGQQYCLIDKQMAFYGYPDLGLQQASGQGESAVLTRQESTVARLLTHFGEAKKAAFRLDVPPQKISFFERLKGWFDKSSKSNKSVEPGPPIDSNPTTARSGQASYEHVLDSMIAAEVSNFDRKIVRQQGYERARANNGDAQVLSKGLDSVYSVFVNEINVIEDKKARLIGKIEEQRAKSTHQLLEEQERQAHTLDVQTEAQRENLLQKVQGLESQVAVQHKEIENIRNTKIPALENENDRIESSIKAQEHAFVKPGFKWFEFLPISIINLGLLFYLFFFYSSAAYILLFSELDAKEARLRGITVNPPEVFNPEAISMAIEKGGTALSFILLFVFVPLSLALIGRFVGKMNWWKTLLTLTGIVLVDAFIAYKVAEAIHNVDYLTGNVDELWEFTMAFQDLNFYLVFILGALGLLLFKLTFERLMQFFEERSPDINYRKNQQKIRHLRSDIADNMKQKNTLEAEIGRIEQDIIRINADITTNHEALNSLSARKAAQAEKLHRETQARIQAIERTTDIYKAHIENDVLPISVDSVKDRINVFLEGWNDFLHDEYSVNKAMEKSRAAAEVATDWQTQKLSSNRLDQRITSKPPSQ